MAWILGVDEAGYGPNLGPLVVSVSVWESVSTNPSCDFWKHFSNVISQTPTADRLHIADSKSVYSAGKGLTALEAGVWGAASLLGREPRTLTHLLEWLGAPDALRSSDEPWFDGASLAVPRDLHLGAPPHSNVHSLWSRWAECSTQCGIRLHALQADVVCTRRFNALCEKHGNKAAALSQISLALVRRTWPDATGNTPVLVVFDKHGGRNRYSDLLPVVVDDGFIQCHGEGRASSVYRVGSAEFRFEMQAERHLPVALSSMVSKTLRELMMELFNQYWRREIPGIKPTAGYPEDARRFRAEIEPALQRLAIPEECLWRNR